jgi:hypothetical protein
MINRTVRDTSWSVGDWVQEVGSDLVGTIVRAGKYPGEWEIQLSSGGVTTCLAENLHAASPTRIRL